MPVHLHPIYFTDLDAGEKKKKHLKNSLTNMLSHLQFWNHIKSNKQTPRGKGQKHLSTIKRNWNDPWKQTVMNEKQQLFSK